MSSKHFCRVGCVVLLASCSLTMKAAGYQDLTYTGTLDGDRMNGNLNGSGFSNCPLTLTRAD